MLPEQSSTNTQQEQHLFDVQPDLVRATTGQRFLNYLIDVIAYYIFAILLGVVIAFVSPDTISEYANSSGGINLLDRLLSLVLYAIFMSIVEAVTKGRSLGKLITGTKAVNLDGTPITAGTAFGRGFSRAVPFCVFSAFGTPCNPWQDKWTNTRVIDIKKSRMPDAV